MTDTALENIEKLHEFIQKHLRQFLIPAANSQSSLKWAPYL